ncbi:MAG: protein kinase [Rhodobacterales bacterium]|nr:protein kinase [Rhodobacterales bacterium]
MTNAALPEQIGPYGLLRPIARGGMAEVYEVEDLASGEHLALKFLLETGGALPRFNREYEAMIRLNHPNIVRVFHYGMFGKLPWLTMELVDGTPIQAYAKRCGTAGTARRTAEVIRTAHDLALAIDHIHRRGLVHRDLKSANVLVLPDGRVKLIDFGTARVSDAVEDITREGEFIGTFAYASPEQLTQKPADSRSDLYSLGVLLYRMATGKRPFNAKELHALARQHVKEIPRPPRELTKSLPLGLEDIILALLEKKPENRPQSGADVAKALEAVAGHPLVLPGTLDVNLSKGSLVGREEQIAQLWRFLDGPTSTGPEPGASVFIVGLQGSGRQKVINAVETDVRKRNWRVFSWFFHRDGDPLDGLAGLLGELSRSFEGSGSIEVRAAKTALAQVSRVTAQSASDRISALVRAADVLFAQRAAADGEPILLVVRGLHHAGPLGMEALIRLRKHIRSRETRVVIAADCVERADDPDSPARRRMGDALRVHLPPLSPRHVALLVGSLLNRRPPPGVVARRIYEASGGLPEYVEAVVRGMVDQGILRVQGRDANRLEWARQDLDIPIPKRARQRVKDSLASLPADRRRVLEALSLLDGQSSAQVLAGALQCRVIELTPALDDLQREGWIAVYHDEGAVHARWRHVIAEKVVKDQMHLCRRRVLERRLIEQVAEEPAFAAQIRLLMQVGWYEEAMHGAADWGLHHLSKNAPESALQVLDEVMPHVLQAPISKGDKSRLFLLHVAALLMARPTDPNTSKSLANATQLGHDEPDHFRAEIHLLRARIQRVIGHYPNFRDHLMKAWYLIEHGQPSALGANVAGLLGWSNRAAGHIAAAATWHGRARRIAVTVGVEVVRAHADVGVSGWQFARGKLVESEGISVAAIGVFDQVGDMRGLSMVVPVWASALREQGRFSEVLEVLYRQTPNMRQSESPSLYVRMLLSTAWAEVDVCRLGRAQECVDELAATLRKGEHLDLRLESDLVWGRILLASGQFSDAQRRLQFVRDRAQSAGLGIIAYLSHALLGETLWGLGDHDGALAACLHAVAGLKRSGHVPATAMACMAQARAMGHAVDPVSIFSPVSDYMEHQPCVVVHVERALAQARYADANGCDKSEYTLETVRLLTQISKGLNDTDRAALRLHPWSREMRRTT